MYKEEKNGDIICDNNGTIVARPVNGQLKIRQGLIKKRVMGKIRMDIPHVLEKYGINPETDDPGLFVPSKEEFSQEGNE